MANRVPYENTFPKNMEDMREPRSDRGKCHYDNLTN